MFNLLLPQEAKEIRIHAKKAAKEMKKEAVKKRQKRAIEQDRYRF